MATRDSYQLDIDKILCAATVVFWDFDGVIKDSVEVKSIAFESLFLPYGQDIARRVRQHHEANGGISRFDKIPLYLRWAGEPVNDSRVNEFCDRFSKLVLQAVIDSPWVPGVHEYLLRHYTHKYFVLVTATPQDGIQHIVDIIDIAYCFREVHGAPKKKDSAIGDVLHRLHCNPTHALMVGDADTDLMAAQTNSIPFLLRRTLLNKTLRASYAGPIFDHLNHE